MSPGSCAKISVIGTGYVGLVAGACFSDNGNDVWCVDVDEKKIDALRRGEVPIYEPGLQEMIARGAKSKRLRFTTDLPSAVEHADIVFVCVGTPSAEDGSPDMAYLFAAVCQVARAMNGPKVVVLKSTVPVGTAEAARKLMAGHTDHEFDVVSNPEFLKEGAAVDDFLRPDRVIIGTDNPHVAAIMRDLYKPFVLTGKPVLVMDNASTELAKYGSNALLATRISFMNELANLADRVGADINAVRQGMASDSRIGPAFLFAGVGFGGSCFQKDVDALCHTAGAEGMSLKILRATNQVNLEQKRILAKKIIARFGDLRGKRIAIWGLAFKPRTDDMREAPSLSIIEALLEAGAQVRAYDPVAAQSAYAILGDRIEYADQAYDALEGADALALVTEWNEFRRPDWERVRGLVRQPIVFDGRNLYDSKTVENCGFEYYGIGRGRSLPRGAGAVS
ncbi:MAG: UDP-glucose dehydrogenase family protein [Planctomycetota bacterium]